MTTLSNSIAASAVGALFAVVVVNVYAANPVRAGGPSDEAGRSLDNDAVKSQGTTGKPGRALLSDGVVRTIRHSMVVRSKPSRMTDEPYAVSSNSVKAGRVRR